MLPLQSDPADPVGIIGTLLLVVVAYVVGTYVHGDANARGMNGRLWGVAAALGVLIALVPGLLVLVVYLVVRG
jgi:hypothetical protein